MAVQLGLCRTWSKPPKTVFLTTRLKNSPGTIYHAEKKTDYNILLFICTNMIISGDFYENLPAMKMFFEQVSFLEKSFDTMCTQ